MKGPRRRRGNGVGQETRAISPTRAGMKQLLALAAIAAPFLHGCDNTFAIWLTGRGWKNGTYVMHEYVEPTCKQKDEFFPGTWDSKVLCASQHPNEGGVRYIACFTEQPDRSRGKDYRESDTPAFGFAYRDGDGSWIGQGVVQGHSDDRKNIVCSTTRVLMGPL